MSDQLLSFSKESGAGGNPAVLLQPQSVCWVRKSFAGHIGNTAIGLLGDGDSAPSGHAVVEVLPVVTQNLEAAGVRFDEVKLFDMALRPEYHGHTYFVVRANISLVRPAGPGGDHWVIRFKDGSELIIQAPGSLRF